MLYLGKRPPRIDNRTLKFSTILKLSQIPVAYHVDSQFPNLADNRMLLNDKYGCCVISERGHHTFRFEDYEQKVVVPISDSDIQTEYFKETGGPDTGLVYLNAMNLWRTQGWMAGGKRYFIHAFASLNIQNLDEVNAAIFLLNGIAAGLNVPAIAENQFNQGLPWDVVPNDGGILGGHAVYVEGYDGQYYYVWTWGKRQPVTKAFWLKYFDEGFAIIDERDNWLPQDTDPLDIKLLEQYLSDVTGTPSQQISVLTLQLPVGHVGQTYSAAMDAQGGTPPYTWKVTQGALMPGLTMSDSGMIGGTPTLYGSTNVLFSVTDSVGNGGGVQLTLTIDSTPTPSPCKVGNGIASGLNRIQTIRGRRGRFAYYNP